MSVRAVALSRRRGACPGLAAPMPTGDGLLARLSPAGTIALDAFRGLCAAARQHGNGIIEVTARGSVQIRGLTAASAPRFADAVAALAIAAADGVPVLTNALAGLDPDEILDAGAVAADLRRKLARASFAASLAPKVSVVIDGGGALGLDEAAADVRLRAELMEGEIAFRVGVGGERASAITLGAIAPSCAVEAALQLLEMVASRGRDARARDVLAAAGIAPFRSALRGLLAASALPGEPGHREADIGFSANRQKTDPTGQHRLRDGSLACGIAPAFGHADAEMLARLAEAAYAAGASGMRAAPGRTLMIIGLRDEAARRFAATAERLGFIVRADDPRRYVIACAGAPVCSSAHIAARAIAPFVAAAAGAHLDASFKVHISGCGKGCAHAGSAKLTVVGLPHGCALVGDGGVCDAPFALVATDQLPTAIGRYVREANCEPGHG